MPREVDCETMGRAARQSGRRDSKGQGNAALTADGSVFAYNLFLIWAEFPRRSAPVPVEQWQGAVGRRSLTPQEQAARESHFRRRISKAISRLHPV